MKSIIRLSLGVLVMFLSIANITASTSSAPKRNSNSNIEKQLAEFEEMAKDVADGFIVDGEFHPGGYMAQATFIDPCLNLYEKLKNKRMTESQSSRFKKICNSIQPLLDEFYPSENTSTKQTSLRIDAMVGKYPVTFVFEPSGEYVGYYYYHSKGENNKIWLKFTKILDTEYFNCSGLCEYVNNKKIGEFGMWVYPNGTDAYYATDADIYKIEYYNNQKKYVLNFKDNNQKMKFVSFLFDLGFEYYYG